MFHWHPPKLLKRLQDKKTSDIHIIQMLTALRISGYSTLNISQITEDQFLRIKELVINLGYRILKANLTDSDTLEEAQLQFKARMDTLFDLKQKFSTLSFACQLLQYFTITSDKKFDSEFGFQELIQFLEGNRNKFGAVSDNLFITEYQLIKIYNDLNYFIDSVNGKIAPIENMKLKINFFLAHLNELIKTIENKISADEENAFLHYLNFAQKYTCAKLLELLFIIDKHKSEDEDKIALSEAQRVFLVAAKTSLQSLEKLTEKELNPSSIKGIEYSYGRNILSKMPITNIELIKNHLHSLTLNESIPKITPGWH